MQDGCTHPCWLRNVTVTGVLTMSFCLSWMFQCVKCDVSRQGRAEEVVQHFLREHLKPSEVPLACNQFQFRACTRQVVVDHRRGKHQAPKGEDLDKICYGTLKPIREEEIFKLLPELHRPEAEGKQKQRSKEDRRARSHGWPFHGEKCSGHRDKQEVPRAPAQVFQSSEGALTKEEEAEPSCATRECR